MNMNPLLSIIAANYNNACFISECLDSILVQTYKNLEIIVSDDCSTDHSPEIIKDYEKKYPGIVKGIFNPVNRGVAQTRHEAILQARGEYITTLDSDDVYYNSEKLENEMKLVRLHKETFNKDVCVFSDTVILDKDLKFKKSTVTKENLKEGDIFNEMITRRCFVPRDMVFLKSAYWAVGGYDPAFKIREDWDLKIRLAKKYEYYYTGAYGTGYRMHTQGLSSSSLNKDSISWLRSVFQKNLHLVEEEDKEEVIRQFEAFIKRKMNASGHAAHAPYNGLR